MEREASVRGFPRFLSGAVLLGLAFGLALVPLRATSALRQGISSPSGRADGPVPAYHAQSPKGGLPLTLSPEFFADPIVQNAYAIAARMRKTLYQQPCYCHCDRSQGHASLFDCFTSRHGSGCNICINEDFYSYEQSRKGRTAAQIREGIIRGEWQSVDTTKYQKLLPAK